MPQSMNLWTLNGKNCGGSVYIFTTANNNERSKSMGYTATKLVEIAEAEIGYHEKASNSISNGGLS